MSGVPPDFVIRTLTVLVVLFVFIAGVGILAILLLCICDVSQSKHAIRRYYLVIGRFRYLFKQLDTFFH